jgi:hypothetical protein
MLRLLLVALIVAILTAACGPTAPPVLPHPTALPDPEDALAVLEILKARGLPIGDTLVYTAETDINQLLGQPGGYTSKVAWRDTRVPPGDQINVGAGGSVEFFPERAEARRRGEYVSKTASVSPMFTEYTMVQGRIVLRLSKTLTPAQAEEYRVVLAEMPG